MSKIPRSMCHVDDMREFDFEPTPSVTVHFAAPTFPVAPGVVPVLCASVFEGSILKREDLRPGRRIAYQSRGVWRWCSVVGWQDYRREKIILRPENGNGNGNSSKTVLRTFRTNDRWLAEDR